MEELLPLVSAFMIGLLGSIHCLGMCGGIVGTLTLGLPAATRASWPSMLPYQLTYNAGRIASYAAIGAMLGGLSGTAFAGLSATSARGVAAVISSVMMIALGLYLAGWWSGMARLEQFGARLWRYIEPLGRQFLPVRHLRQAAGLGLVWGWLPCGLVYAALIFSLGAGSAADGAARMLAFGLGTLPMMLLAGYAAHWTGGVARHPWTRRSVGFLVMSFGFYILFRYFVGMDQDHSRHIFTML